MKGLTNEQVKMSREKYGSNKLPEPKLKKWYEFAIENIFGDKTLMLLLALSAYGIFAAVFGLASFSEPIMVILVISLCTYIGVKMALGIQKSTQELRAKTSTRYCDVIRDGQVQTINKDNLVVGDVVCIGTGQEIYADGYIIEGKISVSNAAINGESKECQKIPINGYVYKKSTSTDDFTNQNSLFAGTTILSGEGKMIVGEVGVNTINGDTLVKMQTLEPPKTALQIAIDKLCDTISRYGTIAAVVTFIALMVTDIAHIGFREYINGGVLEVIQKIAQNISVALTIIVAAVPEGLPLIIKLVTKQNVKTMERFNILAKNPNKIPELAYVDLICTDKTGTLTTGVMTPTTVIDGYGNEVDQGTNLWDCIKQNICLNNSATYDAENNITGGNSIDRAILKYVDFTEFFDIQKNNKIIMKQVFQSEYKYSSCTSESGISYYKGAPEKLIEHCSKMLISEPVAFNKQDKERLLNVIKSMTKKSMRCIALAMANGNIVENTLPDDMVFLGIIGVVDPVRKEVPQAVQIAHEAGIQVIEITGDCHETAVAVATEACIYKEGDLALTNAQFEAMSDDEIKKIIPTLRVISRCSPNTKLRLVSLAQELGRSVGMTGDGTNDSPALKKADVGFGMEAGTDVAKEASDIILTDNNFASIIRGVELGRTFMHDIMMFLEFQLPINFSLLVLSILFPILSGGALLASVQILIINIIMDSLNSLSFGGEPPKAEYMTENPIKKGSGLFIRGAKKRITISTVTFIVLYGILMFSPVSKLFTTDVEAMTARFAMLCIMSVCNGFGIRTEHINLLNGLKNNKTFVYIAAGIVLGTIALCNALGGLIQATAMNMSQWIAIIGLSLTVIVVDVIRKLFIKGENKNHGTI
ncbi:cation-transporting P-type ATPase [Blautia sp. AF17-9LB]|uniref:cation-translocating P-type ATPase n=1 Tax=Blautia sp. AF17-9LB TaxID=2292959 RepID=UPI000E49836B|nr:cation-transporting P-type ATPase [Blautia sp. AF17-9LB]RHR48561.1 cation-transporting P-type ATPase [Blautia sp. AF17-9LB]